MKNKYCSLYDILVEYTQFKEEYKVICNVSKKKHENESHMTHKIIKSSIASYEFK